jgi:heme/copper-type cytochrome/quinol oxidase subunit 2
MKKFLILLLIFCVGLGASVALAQTGNEVEIVNPLGEQSIWGVINRAINFLFMACLYGGMVMIIWAGWTYITSQGDAGKNKKAMQMISSVIIGIVIVLLARAIIGFTYYIVTGNKGGLPNLGGSKTEVQNESNTPYVPESSDAPALNAELYSQ